MTTTPPDSRRNLHEAVGARPPETTDRLLAGACGAIWLVCLVVGVIATVALVNLGSGRGGSGEQSSWLLYTIIGVSGVTIAAAIPLLMRARREALAPRPEPAGPPPAPVVKPRIDAPTEQIRVFGTTVDPQAVRSTAAPVSPVAVAVERESLRGTLGLLSAMGLAMIGVGTASYLLAVGSDTAAWAGLVVAGLFTAAMPAVTVVAGRRLDAAAR